MSSMGISRRVRLKVEIHEIQFSEVTNYRNPSRPYNLYCVGADVKPCSINYRNPRNPPPISRNPHAKKRNPTPATKSTATPAKANYQNPPALDCEPRFLNFVAITWL